MPKFHSCPPELLSISLARSLSPSLALSRPLSLWWPRDPARHVLFFYYGEFDPGSG